MKKIRTFLMAIVALCGVIALTSCEEKVQSTYYMYPQNWSTNASANTFLQLKVSAAVKTDGEYNSFFGEDKEAKSWFNSECDKMETADFVDGIPMGEDSTVEMVLKAYGHDDNTATRTVTFYVAD